MDGVVNTEKEGIQENIVEGKDKEEKEGEFQIEKIKDEKIESQTNDLISHNVKNEKIDEKIYNIETEDLI